MKIGMLEVFKRLCSSDLDKLKELCHQKEAWADHFMDSHCPDLVRQLREEVKILRELIKENGG